MRHLLFSFSANTCHFFHAAPTSTIDGLSLLNVSATEVTVGWVAPPCEELGGPVSRYEVELSSLQMPTNISFSDSLQVKKMFKELIFPRMWFFQFTFLGGGEEGKTDLVFEGCCMFKSARRRWAVYSKFLGGEGRTFNINSSFCQTVFSNIIISFQAFRHLQSVDWGR